MRLRPALAAAVLAAGPIAVVALAGVPGAASHPTPTPVSHTRPTWGVPIPCPPHCNPWLTTTSSPTWPPSTFAPPF